MLYTIITSDIVNYTLLSPEKREELINGFEQWTQELTTNYQTDSELFRGDSFQFLIQDISLSLKIALMNRAYFLKQSSKNTKIDLRQAIGIGNIDQLASTLSHSDGEAFHLSGRLFDGMDKKGNRMVLASIFPALDAEFQTSLTLLEVIIQQWTATQAAVFFHKIQGLNEKEIAHQLGISQPAINKHLKALSWKAIETLLERFETITKTLNV